jgi:hypothetical protein
MRLHRCKEPIVFNWGSHATRHGPRRQTSAGINKLMPIKKKKKKKNVKLHVPNLSLACMNLDQ